MALVEGEAAFFDDAGGEPGLGRARADRANAAVALGDAINLRTHFRRGQKRIAPFVHRRAAGMRGLAVKSDRVTFDAECSDHRRQWPIQVEQHRTLFDVQFEIGRGIVEFFAAIFHLLEVDSVRFERGGKRDAFLVFQFSRFLQIPGDPSTPMNRKGSSRTARLLRRPSPPDAPSPAACRCIARQCAEESRPPPECPKNRRASRRSAPNRCALRSGALSRIRRATSPKGSRLRRCESQRIVSSSFRRSQARAFAQVGVNATR